MRLTNSDRQMVWDKFNKMQFTIQGLKSIAQNPIEYTEQELKEWVEIKKSVQQELDAIETVLRT